MGEGGFVLGKVLGPELVSIVASWNPSGYHVWCVGIPAPAQVSVIFYHTQTTKMAGFWALEKRGRDASDRSSEAADERKKEEPSKEKIPASEDSSQLQTCPDQGPKNSLRGGGGRA